MSDHQGFLASIILAPDDDMPRLAYADWLDEQAGMATERGELIRLQCELAKAPQCRNPVFGEIRSDVYGSTVGVDRVYRGPCGKCAPCVDRYFVKDPRAQKLIESIQNLAAVIGQTRWVRGFVEEITTSPELFLKHADKIIWHDRQLINCTGCKLCNNGLIYIGVSGIEYVQCHQSRSCPETAQPIRKVDFTQRPEGFKQLFLGADGSFVNHEWPGIQFTMPSATEALSDDDVEWFDEPGTEEARPHL